MLDTGLAMSPGTVFREPDGEAVVRHVAFDQCFGLDPGGTRIWTLLGDHGRPCDSAAVLVGEDDVGSRQLERDPLGLLARLAERDLIHVVP